MEKKTQRVQVNLSYDNYIWFKERASEMGVSMSAYMAMALDNHKMQQIVTLNMPELLEAERRMRNEEKV